MAIFNTVYGGEWKWKPGANTIVYYPLNSIDTVNDLSGNNRNLTNNNISFGTFGGVDCANNSTAGRYLTRDLGLKISDTNFTINMWIYKTGGQNLMLMFSGGINTNYKAIFVGFYSSQDIGFSFWGDDLSTTNTYSNNTWYNVCATYNKTGKSQKIYINGQLSASATASTGTDVANTSISLFNDNRGNRNDTFYGGISRVIVESAEWDSDKISAYYNQTKSNYGL